MDFDESKATPDELWDFCLQEYKNQNIIVKYLFENFFRTIKQTIESLDPNDRILEIGCGAGESSRRIINMLSEQYFEVSEYDERYIEILTKTEFPVKITQESVYQLNRKDNEFNCIILLEVLEHLYDYRAALQEIFRVAERHVIISVPNEPLWSILNMLRGKYIKSLGNTPGHVNRWSRYRIAKLIEEFATSQTIYTPIPWIVIHAKV